jgi:hypothetical protein
LQTPLVHGPSSALQSTAWQVPLAGLHGAQGFEHFSTQVLLRHRWQLVHVLTQFPLPSQVWHGPHLLLHTPFEQTWHCLPSQQPAAPQAVLPAGHCAQIPLMQFPLAQSLPLTH